MKPLFQGTMVALVTPLKAGAIDEAALRRLVERQIDGGTTGLVPCGTTGESPALTYDENERVIRIVVEQAAGRVPVLAGAGSNATANAVQLTRRAAKAGAQGTLHVVPYYNKPTQEGLFLHYQSVAAATDLPVVLYNIPGRTAVNLTAETTIRLSKIANIVGCKECSGDWEQVRRIRENTDKDFLLLSGDDPANLQMYEEGGAGCISVAANLVPEKVAAVWEAFQSGNRALSLKLQEELQPLNRGIFMETNPIPVKTALAMMGFCEEEFRLPLCGMGPENRKKLKALLKGFGLCQS